MLQKDRNLWDLFMKRVPFGRLVYLLKERCPILYVRHTVQRLSFYEYTPIGVKWHRLEGSRHYELFPQIPALDVIQFLVGINVKKRVFCQNGFKLLVDRYCRFVGPSSAKFFYFY
jgi:hypothetical protein